MDVSQTKKMVARKLILFPIPLQGHITPMLHLANVLYSKNFSVTIIQTRYNSIDPKHFPHFTFHYLDDEIVENTRTSSDNLVPSLTLFQVKYKEPFRVCLGRVLSEGVEEGQDPFGCLVTDALWFFSGDVAESFGLPRVVLRTSSVSAFVVNHSLPLLREKGYFLPEANPDEPVQEIPSFKVKDLPGEEHHDILAEVVKQTTTSQGVICNTFEELESSSIAKVRNTLSTPIFPIGPLHKYSQNTSTSLWTQDQTSISWLNTQAPNSVLYVSFGSVAAISKPMFMDIALALANSKQPFLWVVRPGLTEGSECIDPLPEGYLETVKERGHIVKWAPQVEVLAHPAVGGFWTHCGWNSTIESISEGVPMICLPFFVDQAMNARHVCEVWKVGVLLEKGVGQDHIETEIRKLMVEVEGQEMRSRAACLKDFAAQCLLEGGSSARSLDALSNYFLSC